MWGLGTTTFNLPSGNNYYAAYDVVKNKASNYNWVNTDGSPGNSGSSYTAPTGWLEAGSGKPGYGYINVQSGKKVSFYVSNCTSVTILGAANSGTRTLNLSVTNNGNEVGSVATISGTTIQELPYGSALDATKSYVVTVSASSANNAKFCQILFVGGSSTSGGEQGGGQQGGGQQGGGQQGGSSTDCGELIKVVLSGDRAATQTVTGTVGGTAGVKSMGNSSAPYKLNTDGAYVYVKLANGHYFQTGDVLTIDGSKAMEVHTGDIANGNSTMLDHTAGPSNGVITYTLPANLPANTNTLSVYRSSGTYNGTLTYMAVNRTCTGPAPLSTDATLSDLKVDGQTVTGFAAGTTSYNVTIPATQTVAPVVAATANHSAAVVNITQAQLPTATQSTTASVMVTAENGTSTKTYTITFTRAQLSHDADLKDIKINGQSISGFTATTTTYNVTVPFSTTTNTVVTATTNHSAANAVITGPNGVTGTATIVVTAEDGTTKKTYTVNITKAAASSDATLSALQYNGTSVPNFSANTLTYSVELPYGTTTAAQVTATANYSAANVQITQPTAAAGSATIAVTAEDGTTTQTYTITFTVAEEDVPPVPPTTLTLHTPGTYEEKSLAGGYEKPLTVLNGREYEVYYLGKNDNSFIGVRAGQQQSDFLLTNSTTSSSSDFIATDQWFKGHVIGSEGKDYLKAGNSPKASAIGEFDDLPGDVQMKGGSGNGYMELYVSGYDQFSIVAADGNDDASKGKYFIVKIDDIPQQMAVSKSTVTIRPFSMSTGKHVIRVEASGDSNCKFYGFSLRIAQEPRLKKITGNDSTQNVLVTTAMKPITYFTKYNALGRTELVWDGAQATGINLTKGNSSSIGDSLIMMGTAQCAAGTYHFHVVAYNAQNKETSRENGTITISTKIQRQTPDSLVEGYTGEAIEDIQFRYYALSADSVTLTWTGNTPAGISGSGTNGIYTITGTPTQVGDFPFTISVNGGNSIVGMLRVQNSDLGNNPILYLYKNNLAYEKDGIYQYLTQTKRMNLIARKAKSELRTTEQYAPYTLIIISEDVDATNEEALAIIRGEVNKPVLNMKSFTYAPGRLDWGEPDNGSLVNRSVIVRQPTHPIFTKLGKKRGDAIVVLDSIAGTGLMPVAAQLEGTLCLATAMTRGREYMEDGTDATFLHEIPASMRGGNKYLTFPVSIRSSQLLSNEGKNLLVECINYLLSSDPTIQLPELEITEFRVKIDGTYYYGKIDNNKNEIIITVPAGQDLTQLVPEITLKDAINTHIDPAAGSVVDLSDSFFGVDFTVSDYVNQRTYNVRIVVETGLEDILEEEGWVNIYDIRGQKVTTTNDVRGLSLPSGIYIVVGQNGSHKISVQ